MSPPRITLDPEGYYARLGIDPWSTPDVITAAYRRKARLIHPDVPGTGDAGGFMALKQAYDVLIHADRRAAYDRSARPEAQSGRGQSGREQSGRGQSRYQSAPSQEPGEIDPLPHPEMTTPRTRHPRLRDLPAAVWAGMAAVLMVGAIEIGLHLNSSSSPTKRETIPATARDVPPPVADAPMQATYGPAPVRLAGTPNFYIVPTASPAMLWRADETRQNYIPWGQLPPFSAVQGLRLIKSSGMVEVKVTDSANGFIEAGRLTPGDTTAAARAWCTFHAGPTPANGELLTRGPQGQSTRQSPGQGHAGGHSRLSIDNRSGQPAVVKIRSPEGAIISSVFLGPREQTTLEGLPDEPVRLDFATGEMWSRACHGFTAGMRAQRLPSLVTIGTSSRLEIPPGPAVAPVDLPDQAFEQE